MALIFARIFAHAVPWYGAHPLFAIESERERAARRRRLDAWR